MEAPSPDGSDTLKMYNPNRAAKLPIELQGFSLATYYR